MVSTLTTILPRFTGAWAMRLQSDAMLTVCHASG
jgi:hypothetical protein